MLACNDELTRRLLANVGNEWERTGLPMRNRIFTFTAWSGAGKTTFAERVVGILARRGLRVAAVKHHGHARPLAISTDTCDAVAVLNGSFTPNPDPDPDPNPNPNPDPDSSPNPDPVLTTHRKDSDRYLAAGAFRVVVSSPLECAVWEGGACKLTSYEGDEDSLAELACRYGADADLVVAEGYKSAPINPIEICRAAHDERPVVPDEALFALATDSSARAASARAAGKPILPLDGYEACADLICAALGADVAPAADSAPTDATAPAPADPAPPIDPAQGGGPHG